jgi:hypothetical protein
MLFHQFAVATTWGLFAAVAFTLPVFVVGVRAFVVNDFTFAFERKDVSADSVEEPTVVADNNSATCEVVETFLKSAESVDVDIIGRFVEE